MKKEKKTNKNTTVKKDFYDDKQIEKLKEDKVNVIISKKEDKHEKFLRDYDRVINRRK